MSLSAVPIKVTIFFMWIKLLGSHSYLCTCDIADSHGHVRFFRFYSRIGARLDMFE